MSIALLLSVIGAAPNIPWSEAVTTNGNASTWHVGPISITIDARKDSAARS